MTDEEREEILALREEILTKLGTLAQGKEREWVEQGLQYMAYHLCAQWPVSVLNVWILHLDWMLEHKPN